MWNQFLHPPASRARHPSMRPLSFRPRHLLLPRPAFRRAFLLAAPTLLTAALAAAPGRAVAEQEPSIRVCVSVPPQAFLVDSVGGERVSVSTLAEAGQSPHTFEPTPALITRVGASDICFTIGLPFEETVLRDLLRTNPELLVVDSGKGIVRRESDPHVWLDPAAAAMIATNIRDGLAALDPGHSKYYDTNLVRLLNALDDLDKELAALMKPFEGASFYVFHPAFGYFAEAYGLNQVAIEIDGKEPASRDLARVVSAARRDGATAVFVQPQHPARIAKTVADEIDATVTVLDPLAYDYFASLRTTASAIAGALRPHDGAAPGSPPAADAEPESPPAAGEDQRSGSSNLQGG